MVTDSWLAVHSKSTTVPATGATSSTSISALDRITKEGITCNSTVNTWTAKHDPKRAKRLDYVFVNQDCAVVKESTVVFTEVMPKYSCSYSDHFGINVKLQLTNRGKEDVETQVTATDVLLPQSLFDDIEGITDRYIARAVRQSRYRIYHFFASCVVVVGLLIGQWWVQSTYGQFLILLGGLVVLGTGIVDGLIGFIFGRWELHALQEFMSETQLARKLYLEGPGGL
jgi:sphingomyelin phosphodiesterase 2